jgi:hypothetical protein
MDFEVYRNFCVSICEDKKSEDVIRSLKFLPDDIQQRILDEFSTRTLSGEIHPVKSDDILMASNESYRRFTKRSKTPIGFAINQSMLATLIRVKQVSSAYDSDLGDISMETHTTFQ